MTREEWLAGFAREHLGWEGGAPLPSFPAARARGGRVCDIATDDRGATVLLVAPTLADSLEVAVVLSYLVDRVRVNGTKPRLGQRAARQLSFAWRVDGWIVNPTDRRAELLADHVAQFVAAHGDYPAAPVTTSTRRSHARSGVLTLTCRSHSEVRAQQTRRQFATYPVLCGRCATALVEVTR